MVAHHATQRGNRRLPVFFSDDARRAYLVLPSDSMQADGTRCLASSKRGPKPKGGGAEAG